MSASRLQKLFLRRGRKARNRGGCPGSRPADRGAAGGIEGEHWRRNGWGIPRSSFLRGAVIGRRGHDYRLSRELSITAVRGFPAGRVSFAACRLINADFAVPAPPGAPPPPQQLDLARLYSGYRTSAPLIFIETGGRGERNMLLRLAERLRSPARSQLCCRLRWLRSPSGAAPRRSRARGARQAFDKVLAYEPIRARRRLHGTLVSANAGSRLSGDVAPNLLQASPTVLRDSTHPDAAPDREFGGVAQYGSAGSRSRLRQRRSRADGASGRASRLSRRSS